VRALLQRTSGARVRVGGEVVGEIGPGLVILLGVGPDDDEAVTDALARRATELRIFDDSEGRTNLSLLDVGGEALVGQQRRVGASDGQLPAGRWRLRRCPSARIRGHAGYGRSPSPWPQS